MSDFESDNDCYPTEDNAPLQQQKQYAIEFSHSDNSNSRSPSVNDPPTAHRKDAAGQVTSREVHEARQHLAAKRAEHERAAAAVMADHGFSTPSGGLPSLQALREERVGLSEQTRHHKDEQDSLTLDIEGQEGATEVYQVAARVQRYEHFAARSAAYAGEQLPREIDQVVEQDRRTSDEEISAYIRNLQDKRARALNSAQATQHKVTERSGSKAGAAGEVPEDQDDEQTNRTIQHAESNVSEAQTAQEKVRKFRALKTKLSAEIVREKRDGAAALHTLNARTKNAELCNARDIRQCKELNNGNAGLTTNAQLLLSQLNAEHYGFDNAPTQAQMVEDRHARDATPEQTPANNTNKGNSESRSRRQGGNNEDSASQCSRQSKPPLVAMKRTASQQSRDEVTRGEQQQRRASEAGGAAPPAAHSDSRRQSLSKPPLVASKPTASQVQRDQATREEQQQQQVSVPRSRQGRAASNTSNDSRRPSVAGKTTESQRQRVAAN